MLERDPRLCSELLWKELFLRPDELAGAMPSPQVLLTELFLACYTPQQTVHGTHLGAGGA